MMKEDFPPKHYVHWTVPIMLRKPRFMPYPIYPSLAKYKSDPGEGGDLTLFYIQSIIISYFREPSQNVHIALKVALNCEHGQKGEDER